MIVQENDGGGVGHDCGAENFARVNEQCVHEAIRDFLHAYQFVADVQQQQLERLDIAEAIGFAHVIDDGFRVVEHRRFIAPFLFHAFGERKRSDKRGSFVLADTSDLFQFIHLGESESVE